MYRTIFFIFGLMPFINTNTLPSYFTKCKLSDPSVTDCITKNVKIALEHLAETGDKDFQILPLKSVKFDKLPLQASKTLRIDMNNLKINGLHKAIPEIVTFDKNTIHAKASSEKIEAIANYNISGQILVLPIRGSGIINMTYVDVKDVDYKANIKISNSKGFPKFYIESESLTFVPGKVIWHLSNLFDGDKRLGDEMNLFLNDNWKEVFDEVKEAIFGVLAKVFHRYITSYFGKIPVQDIIDD